MNESTEGEVLSSDGSEFHQVGPMEQNARYGLLSAPCSAFMGKWKVGSLMLNVDKIIDWFRDNHMKVNPDKCQCIVFGNVVNPVTFIINGNIVRPEETVKLLGVHIDNKLDFGHHASHIIYVRKLANKLRF